MINNNISQPNDPFLKFLQNFCSGTQKNPFCSFSAQVDSIDAEINRKISTLFQYGPLDLNHKTSKQFLQDVFCIYITAKNSEQGNATYAFKRILLQSALSSYPEHYLKEAMHEALMLCINPRWKESEFERKNFLTKKHYETYERGYISAFQKLLHKPEFTRQPSTCKVLARFLGQLEVAEFYPSTAQSALSQDLCQLHFQKAPKLGKITDEMIEQVICHPLVQNHLPSLIQLVSEASTAIGREIGKDNNGKLKEEILAIILRESFWIPLKSILKANLTPEEIQKWISSCLTPLISSEKYVKTMINRGCRSFAFALLCKKCDPLALKDTLFKTIESSLVQPAMVKDIIDQFCKLCTIPEQSEIAWQFFQNLVTDDDFSGYYSSEEILGIITAFILIKGAQKKILESYSITASSYAAYGRPELFYTIGLEHIADHALSSMLLTTENISPPIPTHLFVENYIREIKSLIDVYNQGRSVPLIPSPYEFYELICDQLKMDAFTHNLISDVDTLAFPPICPSSEQKIVELVAQAIKSYQQDHINRPEDLSRMGDFFRTHPGKETVFSQLDALSAAKNPPEADREVFRPISVRIEPKTVEKIIELDLTLGMTLEKKEATVEHTLQPIEDIVYSLEDNYNDAAFKIFFSELVACTLPVVSQEFEKNWHGDQSLFFGDGETRLLTEEKRKQLLQKAKLLSDHKEIKSGLEQFKRQLTQDINKGKVSPQKDVIKSRYPKFFSFWKKKKFGELNAEQKKEWNAGYQRIVIDALLLFELNKYESNPNRVSGTFIENIVLKARDPKSIDSAKENAERCKKHQAEVEVLKTLLQGRGLRGRDLDGVKKKIEEAKRAGRLKASKIPDKQIKGYSILIDALEDVYKEMQTLMQDAKQKISSLPEDFPEKQKASLLQTKGHLIDLTIKKAIVTFLDESIQLPDFEDLMEYPMANIKEYVQNGLNEFLESINLGVVNEVIEEYLQSDVKFVQKWKNNIKCEMIQGLEDSQEVFDQGVCAALSVRWGVYDQRFPKATAAQLANPEKLKISPLDRFNQLAVALAHDVRKLFSKTDSSIIEAKFPKSFCRKLGIQSMRQLFEKTSTDPLKEEDYREIFKSLAKKKNKLKDSHGVMFIDIYFIEENEPCAHRFYLRFDEKNHVYRLGEPNKGFLEFEGKEKCLSFLQELCENYKVYSFAAFQAKLR